MLLSTPSRAGLRATRPTTNLCACCRFAQAAARLLSSTAPTRQAAEPAEPGAKSPSTPPPPSRRKPQPTYQTPNPPHVKVRKLSEMPQREKVRRQKMYSPPQPGPPSPPFPARGKKKALGVTRAQLTENGIMTSRMRGLMPYDALRTRDAARLEAAAVAEAAEAASAASAGSDAMLRIAIPRLPDLAKDYTEVGPGVVAPWQPGGAKFFSPDAGREAVNKYGGSKVLGVRVRFHHQHVMHPLSVKFLGASEDIAPGAIVFGGQGASYVVPRNAKDKGPFYKARYAARAPDTDSTEAGHGVGVGVGVGVGDTNSLPPVAQTSLLPHCLAEVVRRQYANKARSDPLWWIVHVSNPDNAGDTVLTKQVVRRKTHSKLQHALKTALGRLGYTTGGIRLADLPPATLDALIKAGKARETQVVAKYPRLYGTIRVDAVLQRVLDVDYDVLVDYFAGIIGTSQADLSRQR